MCLLCSDTLTTSDSPVGGCFIYSIVLQFFVVSRIFMPLLVQLFIINVPKVYLYAEWIALSSCKSPYYWLLIFYIVNFLAIALATCTPLADA